MLNLLSLMSLSFPRGRQLRDKRLGWLGRGQGMPNRVLIFIMSLLNGLTRRRPLVSLLSALGPSVEQLLPDSEPALLRDDVIKVNLVPLNHGGLRDLILGGFLVDNDDSIGIPLGGKEVQLLPDGGCIRLQR